jgi:hypothetical protein
VAELSITLQQVVAVDQTGSTKLEKVRPIAPVHRWEQTVLTVPAAVEVQVMHAIRQLTAVELQTSYIKEQMVE